MNAWLSVSCYITYPNSLSFFQYLQFISHTLSEQQNFSSFVFNLKYFFKKRNINIKKRLQTQVVLFY